MSVALSLQGVSSIEGGLLPPLFFFVSLFFNMQRNKVSRVKKLIPTEEQEI